MATRAKTRDQVDAASGASAPVSAPLVGSPEIEEPPRPKQRLVVELTHQTNERLNELVETQQLNKTTVVNRALNLYYLLREAMHDGGEVTFTDGKTGVQKQVHFI